ncbi:MAG: pyrroloquinoline quinone (PQQ) biosynthesis protein C [Candidatus Azotimanducaceae bacterium]|jgi:pyrroloquinoline quinone (PQQ) biosynthesis protein C
MSFYKALLAQTESGKQYLLTAPIIEDVFAGKFDIRIYVAFLNQAFHHVRHTAPLLAAATESLATGQEWIRSTMDDYIEEERGHEAWILNDIEVCGFDRKAFEEGAAPYNTEIMVAYLYDYVRRVNAMGIFGMVLVLEGTSSSLAPAVGKIVQDTLGLPDAAMTYLTTHGELDQDHISYFESAMNKITDADDQAAIIHVANSVYRLYGDVYRAIPNEAASLAQAA